MVVTQRAGGFDGEAVFAEAAGPMEEQPALMSVAVERPVEDLRLQPREILKRYQSGSRLQEVRGGDGCAAVDHRDLRREVLGIWKL